MMIWSEASKPSPRRLVAHAFPPSDPERDAALECLHTSPHLHGHSRSRWSLGLILRQGLCVGVGSVSGVWRRLRKWDIRRKRSRDYLTSPDPQYEAKMAQIQQARQQAEDKPEQAVFLYADEHTMYRQPEGNAAYNDTGRGGKHQPLARRSYRKNHKHRIAGGLDVVTGQVLFVTAVTMGVQGLARFLALIRAAYGDTKTIYVAWDNWPVHCHEKVLKAAAETRISLLFLSTYAPWTNPIEKLWNKLKQELLFVHPWRDEWAELKQQVTTWLEQYATPSPELLHYVGLLPNHPEGL